MIKRVTTSILPKDLIIAPSKYQSTIETILNVPIPGEPLLEPMQKVVILLDEIKKINFSFGYYKEKNQLEAMQKLQTAKECFTIMLQEIMTAQFEITFFKQAA
jgi:hypothetical protein